MELVVVKRGENEHITAPESIRELMSRSDWLASMTAFKRMKIKARAFEMVWMRLTLGSRDSVDWSWLVTLMADVAPGPGGWLSTEESETDKTPHFEGWFHVEAPSIDVKLSDSDESHGPEEPEEPEAKRGRKD